jgi:hypothetical protein
MTWAGLGYLEGKAALPQPPQDPVLGADLRDGREPSDRQHVALLPVAHQERLVVGPLLADGAMPMPGGKLHKGSNVAANSRPIGAGSPSWGIAVTVTSLRYAFRR